MRKVQNMTVVSQKLIAKNVYEIILSGNLVQGMLQAGQFVNIKINEVAYPLLRRPIPCRRRRNKTSFSKTSR